MTSATVAALTAWRAPGWLNDEVGVRDGVRELVQRHRAAADFGGERHAPVARTVDDGDRAGEVASQVLRGEARCFTGADDDHTAVVQRGDAASRQLTRRRGDRHHADANPGLRPRRASPRECRLHQPIQHRARCARVARERKGVFHLAQNLRFAHNHRVEA
jgi:hypothetical protein